MRKSVKTTLICLVFLLNFTMQSHAQVGYLGKRFNFYGTAGLSPSWFMGNRNEETGFFKFDPWFAAGLDITVSKNQSLGFEYQFYNSIYPSYYGDWAMNDTKPMGYDDISVIGYSLVWKVYYDGYAPLGSFFKTKLTYFGYDAKAEHYGDSTNRAPFSSTMIGFELGTGKTYVFKNYLTVTPCLTFGLAYGQGKAFAFKDDLYTGSKVDLADRKIRNMSYINLTVEIGILPF